MKYNKKVDVHSHILTPSYYTYLDKYEGPTPDNYATPEWSEKDHFKLMDQLGIAYCSVSVSSPHIIRAEKDERIALVNGMNEEAIEIAKNHEGRMGLFATLPLPDMDAALVAVDQYLDIYEVDGIGLITNYDGIYLGSDKLDPLMELLNEKGATVCVHPTMPAAMPGDAVLDMPVPVMDFLMDTTRAFTNMVWNDKFLQYPNIKWIWPHGASFMTILSDRFENFAVQAKKNGNPHKLKYFEAMQNCYFDTAGFSVPKQLHDMKIDIPVSHFLYGSDCPYTPAFACKALAGNLEQTSELTSKEKYMMFTKNAMDLNPKLQDILEGTPMPYARKAERKVLGSALNTVNKVKKS